MVLSFTICNSYTLREETFAEETFAISRFLAQFAKVCSREIFVIYKPRNLFSRKKKKSFRLAKVKKSKNLYIYIYIYII